MKKLFTVLLVLVSTTLISAQSFKIGVGGGLTTFTAPESLTKDISEGGFGVSVGYHFGAKARFSLPVIPLAFFCEINYSPLKGEEDVDYNNLYGHNIKMHYETESSLLSIGIGAQYSIIPGPISPYASAEVIYNSLADMKVKYSGTSGSTIVKEEMTVSEKFNRTGVGLGAGVFISVLPLIDIDVNVKYKIVNVAGKEDGEDTMSLVNVNATVFFGL